MDMNDHEIKSVTSTRRWSWSMRRRILRTNHISLSFTHMISCSNAAPLYRSSPVLTHPRHHLLISVVIHALRARQFLNLTQTRWFGSRLPLAPRMLITSVRQPNMDMEIASFRIGRRIRPIGNRITTQGKVKKAALEMEHQSGTTCRSNNGPTMTICDRLG